MVFTDDYASFVNIGCFIVSSITDKNTVGESSLMLDPSVSSSKHCFNSSSIDILFLLKAGKTALGELLPPIGVRVIYELLILSSTLSSASLDDMILLKFKLS